MATSLIEPLQSRLLFAGDLIAIPAGTLQMDSRHRLHVITSDSDDQITITQTGKMVTVADLVSGTEKTLNCGNLRKIIVHLNDGDDSLKLDTTAPVLVRGDYGDDTIIGGAEKDDLYGDNGDDVIYGGGGNDKLHGNAGADALYGGTGFDILSGGRGSDRLYSSEGLNDVADILDGGGGLSVDRFFVSSDDTVSRRKQDIVTVS